ncbi:MAG: glycosyltransferase family 4 protein [Candidatus Pacearchaeota archaeon]
MNKLLLISLQKYGGGAIDALEISEALIKNKFFHYIVISKQNEMVDKFNNNEYRIVFKIETFKSSIISFLINTFLKLKFVSLIKIIINIKPNYIFFTHRHPWQVFVLILKPFLRFRIIYSCHDNPFDPKELENKINLYIDKLLTKKSDILVVYSNFMKNDIERFIKKETILVPLGPYSQLGSFQKENFNTDKLVLGFWGRILPYKGVEILLKAFEYLKKDRLNLDLYILGKGEINEREKKLIEELDVKFINKWLSYEEIFEYIKKIDLMILPYTKATQSALISFCLAIHMPLIVSDAGGLKEFIDDGNTGFIFKSNDYNDLVQKIKIIYENKNLLKIFSENMKNYKSKFDWSQNIVKLIEVL